ncbi:MAG: hypothetical protein AB1513_09270 [Pseudomonadota bacterium]
MKNLIPRNKPKSWILATLTALFGLFIALPLVFGGSWLQNEGMMQIGRILFFGSWGLCCVLLVVFNIRMIMGQYRGMEARDWKDQKW